MGKGVAFDTGGLDIKPASSMLMMRKDMGGAAAALALADMIMGAKLPVRLRVLIPAVENSISSNAFRPGDILSSRKGITVEIGNTDAEGRLILADALRSPTRKTRTSRRLRHPHGCGPRRARPGIAALLYRRRALANGNRRARNGCQRPGVAMPLWHPYQSLLDSKFADMNNTGGPMAGSMTAALFLRRFVSPAKPMCISTSSPGTTQRRPGRPEGGDVQAARLMYALLKERYPA